MSWFLCRILLICLVQAEHVHSLWATQGKQDRNVLLDIGGFYNLWIYTPTSLAAESSQTQNGKRYVGFSQQDSGLRRQLSAASSYPQNQLRHASAQSSSFDRDFAESSGYGQGLSKSGYTQALSQPAQSASVRLVKSNLLSKHNWQGKDSNKLRAKDVPKKGFFGLSAAIASGSSVSKTKKKQNDLVDVSERGTWPVQQGALHASKYPSSSSALTHNPSSKSKLASPWSAAQFAPRAAAGMPAIYGQKSHTPMRSPSLFGAGDPVQMQTSASSPARRVTSRQASRSPASRRPQFNMNGGYGEGYKPPSMSSMTSAHLNSGGSIVSSKLIAYENSRLQKPTSGRLHSTSSVQIPSNTGSYQASWNSNPAAQGANGGNGRSETSGQRFAPTRTYNIPPHFGGFAIRRLQTPGDQKEEGDRKLQQTYTAPSQQSYTALSHQSESSRQQVQSVHPKSKLMRIKPARRPVGKYLMAFCCSVLVPCF